LVKNLIENGGEHAANDDIANYIVIPSSIKTKPDKIPIPTLRPVLNLRVCLVGRYSITDTAIQ